ncbi:MAG: four helix bundle protein [Barnesiella sp.]|nr:four helix bundle protein [Barnesiella sp.]
MNSFLKIAGDYSNWNVYKKSVIICDVTELFTLRALPRDSRTVDQMRQAARSCKQNIVEGVVDGTISSEICIKLLGIARGSLRELLEDYGDFLRQHRLQTWSPNDERTARTRRFCIRIEDPSVFVEKCRARSDETVANIMITQIRQLDSMLTKVLKKLETEFLSSGGLKENMTKARKESRGY